MIPSPKALLLLCCIIILLTFNYSLFNEQRLGAATAASLSVLPVINTTSSSHFGIGNWIVKNEDTKWGIPD